MFDKYIFLSLFSFWEKCVLNFFDMKKIRKICPIFTYYREGEKKETKLNKCDIKLVYKEKLTKAYFKKRKKIVWQK